MELPITLSWNSVLQILSYELASPLTALSTALFLLCWFSVDQFSNPVHAILIKASYMSLWNLTAPLYLRPSKDTNTKPSVKTPDSMRISFNPNALFSQTAFKIRYSNLCIRFGIWKVRRLNQIRSKVAPKLKYPGTLGENNGWDLPNWNRRS